MKLFNTLTRKVEKFVPLKGKRVGIYSCGPTVYNFAHIGNLSTFIFVDLLKRYLCYRGYKVFHVMNITDVDDKTIQHSKNERLRLSEFTKKYSEIFFEDIKALNIIPADVYPKATEHIQEMVSLIKTLLAKGVAYEKDKSIYFKISAFPSYGKLAMLEKQFLKKGAGSVDVDEYAKENINDFVLWKAYKPNEDCSVFWETEIGKGRPGWHIECSAMSMKYLGETFDIHTGGIDLIFPHHENEIAQSEAATGKQFVRYWLHREFLNINSNKMSKSLGNIIILKDIAKSDLGLASFRYLVVSSHYRSPISFTPDSLNSAKNTIIRLRKFLQKLAIINKSGNSQMDKLIKNARDGFVFAMDNDLNSPKALSYIFNLITETEKMIQVDSLTKKSAELMLDFFKEIDNVLGVIFMGFSIKEKVPEEIKKLLIKREMARKNKNWKYSDKIRGQIEGHGYIVEDTVSGQIIKKNL